MSVALASTKTAATENFPVASLLLAPGLRSPVLAFYRFARAADDVADAPDLPPAEKLRRLDALETALIAGDPAEPAAAALHRADRERGGGAGAAQARLLLDAFRQDAVKRRYADWGELLDYCRRSANPVGRFMLALHDEPESAEAPADALCTALQILNHLQDLGPDRLLLDRVYLPLPWLEAAGGEERFFEPAAATARRPILDAALDQTDALLDEGEALPVGLRSPRLAAQAAATIACGRALSGMLRRRDPIAGRVALGPAGVAAALGVGLAKAAAGRPGRPDAAITRGILRRSGSSFRLGIASLEGERRRGMHALYAYCRAVDDLADGAAPAPERRRFLDGWREELDRVEEGGAAPRTPVGRELAWAARRFALPITEFRLLLDGMLTDATDRVRLADDGELGRYCREVAGTVGMLSVRIFGAEGADEFALRLAEALQLVNVLRDVDEDAARDRVYVPRSRLEVLGIPDGTAAEVVADPRFGQAWVDVAGRAEAAFAAAEAALAGLDRRRLVPALLMLRSYRPLLERLRRDGWRSGAPRAKLRRAERARLALMALRGTA